MRKLFASVFMLLAAYAAFAQTDIKVQTHNVVAADEQFNVTFVIEGEGTPSGFTWSPGEGFSLLWGPQQGRSTSVQMINGKTTKSVQTTYTYVLKPVRTGRFTLPQASAKVNGKDIHSSEVTVEVVESGASSRQQQSQAPSSSRQTSGQVSDEDIFLNLSLDRTDVVVGEPVTATLKLYQRVDIAGFESVEFPSFNGFWSQEIDAPSNIEFSRETYDGKIYNSALLRRFMLIPQQQGRITIDPAELVCLVQMRVSSPGSSIFDGFFDDFRTVRKKVASKPVAVNVSALPSGAPSSFCGGVGRFTISSSLSKSDLKTHEAASLLVTVTGTGNISLLEAPKVVFPPDMEVYDMKVSEKLDRNGISGTRYYEFPFIPRSHGDFVIEPVKYSYYDIDSKKYVTLQTQPVGFTVEKGNESESSGIVVPGSSQKDVRTLGSDIRYISVKDHELNPKGRFLVGSLTFWAVSVVILLLACVSMCLLKRYQKRKADVVGSRNRRATKMALRRLKLADTFLKQNLYTAFYEELHKALLGFISDKLAIPVAELSKDNISESLRKGKVDNAYVESFIGILDACEFARYSPDAGHEAMAAHYNAAVDVISSIDSELKSANMNMKTSAVALVLMLMPFAAQAQSTYDVDSLWNSANMAYSEGRWSDAITDYTLISDSGLESAGLYCNTGNAYFKDGNVPMAVLFYKRALKLDPSYQDARYNLEILENMIQDRIEPVPELILKTWARDLCYLTDSDSWTVGFFLLFAVFLALVVLFIFGRSSGARKTGFFCGIAVLIVASMCLGFAIWQKHDYMSSDEAVVMRPVVPVRSSPSSETSKDLFILHEGTSVTVLDRVGNWCNIELADGRQGWIQSSDMELI